LVTPTKNEDLLKTISPQRRILFEPKETTPIKSSPVKCYERYLSLAETEVPALTLPYNYRFLAEIFRCVETVISLSSLYSYFKIHLRVRGNVFLI